MTITRRSFCQAAAASLPLPHAAAWAQAKAWPERPIRFITPYPPGGLSDQVTRFAADRIGRSLGTQVIVENKPGAGATLGTEAGARAAPDGYSFLVAPTAAVAVAPWLRKVNFTAEDFTPVAKLVSAYGLVAARRDAPFADYREFIAAAKAAPGKYTFASNGVGSIVHLTGVLLHKQAGINVVHVPYKGSVESMTDVLAGRVDVMYDPVTLPRVKSGELKGLVSTSAERNPELPQVPSMRELGLDIDTRSWFGLFAPKNTPADIVARVAEAAGKAVNDPGARQQLQASALYPDFEGPAAFARRLREDSAFFRELIQRENIKAD